MGSPHGAATGARPRPGFVVTMRPRTQNAYDAVRRGHNLGVFVELWGPSGKIADVPVVDGSVQWSLTTANGMRSGNLSVPGYEWFEALSGPSYWVNVTIVLETEAFHLGQFPILRTIVTRPGGLVDVTLGDWAWRRSVPQGEVATTIGDVNWTLAYAVSLYMGHVLPPVTVTRDDTNGAKIITPITFQLGGNVWSALRDLCEQHGCVPVMTSRQTAEIRNYDTGTAATEVVDGTIVKESVGILADEACNRVIAKVESTAYEAGDFYSDPNTYTLKTGPYAYNPQGFGAIATVVSERTPNATQAMVNNLAQRTYDRRVGIVRTQALDVIPQPWIECGDIVKWQPSFMSQPLSGRVETLNFPLTPDGAQRMTLRDDVIR